MTLNIAALADVAGEGTQHILARHGEHGDAYIVIISRNCPGPEGSEQSMSTNLGDRHEIAGILRYLANEMEAGRNIDVSEVS